VNQSQPAPADDQDTYYLNMGPQHPSMHGVLRLVLKMRGEEIIEAEPVIGYAHRAHEKMAENRNYLMFLPNTSRIDYLAGMIYNLAYCEAIEKMLEIEVPERALYIRTIASELNRISSHLLWFGTFLLDLGGVTPFLYTFDDREAILDILDRVTGSRLTYCYGRFGGVTDDVDQVFVEQTTAFLVRIRQRMPEYMKLVSDNVIFRQRTEGVGVISQEIAKAYGITGPCVRACGIDYDVRRAEPYGIYDRFDFEVPLEQAGDSFARFRVRVNEMEQSCRIIEQALASLPEGPIQPAKMKKRFKPAAGELYYAVESARGQFGMYIVSDGSDHPSRLKLRTPSFSNLASMPDVLPGTMVADTIAIVGSIDVVMPEIDR
jgi:NADH-quinone oxidoreductase subunit D